MSLSTDRANLTSRLSDHLAGRTHYSDAALNAIAAALNAIAAFVNNHKE